MQAVHLDRPRCFLLQWSDLLLFGVFAAEVNERRVAALHRAIEQLAPDERALITLFYFEARSLAECAVILGVTENNAKVRLHRIRKKLYLLIQPQSDEC